MRQCALVDGFWTQRRALITPSPPTTLPHNIENQYVDATLGKLLMYPGEGAANDRTHAVTKQSNSQEPASHIKTAARKAEYTTAHPRATDQTLAVWMGEPLSAESVCHTPGQMGGAL